MASVTLCNRTISKQTLRSQLKDINLSSKVNEFRTRVAEEVNLPVGEIELVHCGRQLQDKSTLESCGVKPGSTVYALRRPNPDAMQTDVTSPMDRAEIDQVVTALQAALINPAYRGTVEEMLKKPETLENIMAATPGLESDPDAMAMLQTPELLAVLADPNYIHRVIELHPSLGHAAMFIAAAINEEGAKSSATTSHTTYSMDQMSDDEDLLSGPGPSAGGARPMLGGLPRPITNSQLAAALAMAGGHGVPSQSSQGSSPPGASSSSASGSISADFFSQAMMQVTGGAQGGSSASNAAPQPTQPQASQDNLQAQIAELRSMGVQDEAVARHALEAAGGDLVGAVQLLFGDPNS